MSHAWIFTFGHGQRLRSTTGQGFAGDIERLGIGFRLDNRYVRIEADHTEARKTMFDIFGRIWSMEYEAGPNTDEMIDQYGLVELDISEPLAELQAEAARAGRSPDPVHDRLGGSSVPS